MLINQLKKRINIFNIFRVKGVAMDLACLPMSCHYSCMYLNKKYNNKYDNNY